MTVRLYGDSLNDSFIMDFTQQNGATSRASRAKVYSENEISINQTPKISGVSIAELQTVNPQAIVNGNADYFNAIKRTGVIPDAEQFDIQFERIEIPFDTDNEAARFVDSVDHSYRNSAVQPTTDSSDMKLMVRRGSDGRVFTIDRQFINVLDASKSDDLYANTSLTNPFPGKRVVNIVVPRGMDTGDHSVPGLFFSENPQNSYDLLGEQDLTIGFVQVRNGQGTDRFISPSSGVVQSAIPNHVIAGQVVQENNDGTNF